MSSVITTVTVLAMCGIVQAGRRVVKKSRPVARTAGLAWLVRFEIPELYRRTNFVTSCDRGLERLRAPNRRSARRPQAVAGVCWLPQPRRIRTRPPQHD